MLSVLLRGSVRLAALLLLIVGVPAFAQGLVADDLRDFGIHVRDGEVVAGSTAVSYDDYADGVRRLQLLLMLVADPTQLEERNLTEIFARILPDAALDEYMRKAGSGMLYWRGDSEFEQEDSRRLFLDEQRDTILAMRPALPLTIMDFRRVSTGGYDFDNQQLPIEISSYPPWSFFGPLGFVGEIPASFPTVLELPADTARDVVEGTFPGTEDLDEDDRRTTAILRYRIDGVRKLDDSAGVALDIGVLDLKLYADRDAMIPIMDLPLGAATILAGGDERAAPSSGPPMLDETTAYLLAMRTDPALAEDDSLLFKLFDLRREAELRFAKDAGTLNFRRVIPAVLLSDTDLRPNADDIDAFRDWVRESLALIGDQVTFPRNLYWAHSDNRLSAIAGEIDSTPSRDNQDRLRELWPNSVEFGSKRADEDLTVLYGLNPSPHWTDEGILGDETADEATAYVTVKILEARLLSDGRERLLLLNLAPDYVTVTTSQGSRQIDLPETYTSVRTATDDPSTPASRFEVLGIRLGMPIDEARTIIEAAFADKPIGPLEVIDDDSMSSCDVIENRGSRTIRSILSDIEYVKGLGERDGALDTAKLDELQAQLASEQATLLKALADEGCASPASSPLQFAFGFDVQHSDDLVERFVVYQVGELVGTPVVSAIYRQFSPEAIGDRFIDGLKTSFGKDFVELDDGSGQVAWTDEAVYASRFKEDGDERCKSFWKGDDSYPGQYLDVDCGAYVRAESWRMVLIDTRFTAHVLAAQLAAAQAPAEPEIKF